MLGIVPRPLACGTTLCEIPLVAASEGGRAQTSIVTAILGL